MYRGHQPNLRSDNATGKLTPPLAEQPYARPASVDRITAGLAKGVFPAGKGTRSLFGGILEALDEMPRQGWNTMTFLESLRTKNRSSPVAYHLDGLLEAFDRIRSRLANLDSAANPTTIAENLSYLQVELSHLGYHIRELRRPFKRLAVASQRTALRARTEHGSVTSADEGKRRMTSPAPDTTFFEKLKEEERFHLLAAQLQNILEDDDRIRLLLRHLDSAVGQDPVLRAETISRLDVAIYEHLAGHIKGWRRPFMRLINKVYRNIPDIDEDEAFAAAEAISQKASELWQRLHAPERPN
jgi:hypothetical protein